MFPATEPQSLIQLFSYWASCAPNKEAIIAPARLPLTYKNLLTLSQHIREQLNLLGLGSGSRIASILPNSPEAAVAFLAVSSCASFAPLNPICTDAELERYLSDLKPNALIILSNSNSATRILIAQRLNIPVIKLIPELSQGAGSFSLRGDTGLPAMNSGFASAADIALMLYTSGSTAKAKLVPILQQAICQTCINVAEFIELTEQDCCLNALPLFHVHGLISGVLLPLAAGGCCVCISEFQAETFVAYLQAYDPTWYPASPTVHRMILEQIKKTPGFHRNPSLRFIRSGSAPLAVSLINELENILGVPVIEPYGMTEVVHISSNPMPPGIRKQGSVGISYGHCKISVIDDRGQNVLSMTEGEVAVQGPTVIGAYIDNDAANRDSFCAQGFRTGDLGYLDEDGYLFITGRIKEIINRGGEKISPYEVDQVLLAHPAIKEAVTFPVAHATLGENVAAAVVLTEKNQVEAEALRHYIRQKLAEFKVPYRIVISDHLPKGPTGKVQRHKMATYFAAQLSAQESRFNQNELPATELQEKLLTMWRELLNIESIGIHANFLALGGNSLLAMQFIAQVNTQFQVDFPLQLLFEAATVAELSAHLDALLKQTNSQISLAIKALPRQH
ncbi:MAG: non-ribosomal peptide synthetase [Methylobacter sp.]|nr:non-ribosomal peptide synthetase [Candidatus Methylobacter titanis]